ncbi:MAG: hypothetical protein KC561_14900, partial [Myxococcales bacterium]|nr:hypothetical protein [Myxococcales bacterium]
MSPKRLVLFLLVLGASLGALLLLPVDENRAYELAVVGLLDEDLLAEPLAPLTSEGALDEVEVPAAVSGCSPSASERLLQVLNGTLTVSRDSAETGGDRLLVECGGAQGVASLTVSYAGSSQSAERRVPDWRSLVPPLIAILVALFFRRVLAALVLAVATGALLHFSGNPFARLWSGTEDYFVSNLSDQFYLSIIGFTVSLVGMVLVATRSGGSQGLINLVGKFAKKARSTRVAVAIMGLLIFFDDYANSIVVGTTARSMTDAKRISREKLAYLVDSTSAPVAGIAVISTWIAYEVGLLESSLNASGITLDGIDSGYAMFLAMMPFRLYCILSLAFVFIGASSGRDFGPMLAAERRAHRTGQLLRPGAVPLAARDMESVLPAEGVPARWYNAGLPVGVVVLTVLAGMLYSGHDSVIEAGLAFNIFSFQTWKVAFGGADGGTVLLAAGLGGSVVAIALALGQRVLKPLEAARIWSKSIPTMLLALAILVSAWAIQGVCKDLGSGIFLAASLGDSVPPLAFPILIFLLSAAMAFSTGTSWGTMGVMIPLVIPWAWELGGGTAEAAGLTVLSAAAILDGAIMGDHCSPISDTTVMSSMASGCDHVDHVRTQVPYALVTMVIAALGYLAAGFGAPYWLVLVGGVVL